MKRIVAVSGLSSVLACVVLLLIVAGVGAQGPDGGAPQSLDPEALTGTPISSTFTYQGQLKSGGSAVSGVCDFQFGLWDTASGGLQVGVTQTLSAVNVANGLFTVPLNFGASAFTGDARWLAITVRCPAGGGAYAPLNPRQAVTPAPYAAYASGNWGLTGNRGTGASNFLGTTDNTKLTLSVSNTVALRLIPNANAPILIGGYAGNAVNGAGDGSVIAGGGSVVYGANIISGTNVGWSTIGGGFNNQISGDAVNTVIGGGYANQISGNTDHSSISGGWINRISGGAYDSTIGNGDSNQIGGDAYNSSIGSGGYDQIGGTANASAIGSGADNLISGGAYESVIGSGESNVISGTAWVSAIGGGESNMINGGADHSAIGGGYQNHISGAAYYSAIGGGEVNQISANANNSAIGSGAHNQISGDAYDSAIGSGDTNVISGTASYSAIGSGQSNQIGGGAYQSAIGSGQSNQISGTTYGSVIGSGGNNRISGTAAASAIGGGGNNLISGSASASAIGGGGNNLISGSASASTIGGGFGNQISGTATFGAIGGGWGNIISGTTATIPGGWNNTAAGNYSFAAGTLAKASHTGAFVWGDNTFANFASTGNNQFLIRANGGVGVGTNAPAAQLHVSSSGNNDMPQMRIDQTNVSDYARLRFTINGDTANRWDVAANGTQLSFYSGWANEEALRLTPDGGADYMLMGNGAHLTAGGAWTNASDRNVKANFAPVDGRAVLDKVLSLPLSTWNYKAEDAATRHLGPMAQDFYATFGLGGDDKSISTIDPAGVSLAAIQGLYQVVQDKDRRITQLENEVAQLKTDQPFNPFNLISPLLSAVALGGVIVIGLRQKRGGQA